MFRGQHPHRAGLGLPVAAAVPKGGSGQAVGVAQLRKQPLFIVHRGADPGYNGLLVKVGVGDGGEEVVRNEVIHLCGYGSSLFPQRCGHCGNPLGHIHQKILHRRHIGGLPAHAHAGAALAERRFLTLIAKHVLFQIRFLLYIPGTAIAAGLDFLVILY